MSADKLSIIIQAGGKGARLGHKTINIPKCLVNVGHKTLLYHNLSVINSVFDDPEIYIIADYKKDILKAFLDSYPKFNLRLHAPSGRGTASGISEIVAENNLEKVLIMWCDLYLCASSFEEIDISNSIDTICLSRDFTCRWSYIKGQGLIEHPSNEYGVCGIFYFYDALTTFVDMPSSGEFCKYLAKKENYNPLACYAKDLAEVGDLKSYEKLFSRNTYSRARFFNRIDFLGEHVRKQCIVEEYQNVLDSEINWYKHFSGQLSCIPSIYSFDPLVIEKIDGFHPDDLEPSEEIIRSILSSIKLVHKFDSVPSKQDDIINVYLEKTLHRVHKVQKLLPIEPTNICINGKNYINPLCSNNLSDFRSIILSSFANHCDQFVPIHGDPTFSNTIITNDRNCYFIDPRGKFGSSLVYGDSYYDYAKILYSVEGAYDLFNKNNYTVFVTSSDEYTLYLPRSAYSQYSELIYNQVDRPDILRLLHSLIWMSLAGYLENDVNGIIGAFLKGVILYNDFLNTSVNLVSRLPKTWFIDIDGVIVKHNSHLELGDSQQFLSGVKDFLKNINSCDTLVITTARSAEDSVLIMDKIKAIVDCRVELLSNLGHGERILINDRKPSGLKTAVAVNAKRNSGLSYIQFYESSSK
ncbi:mobA-like NTP transferase domain protein [Synechococcus sp. PROS-7-1]|uniref:NTP transferase domain-containing protein n=1 Tax=Synechococcus sp. PROS-7-1 TaxID=1442556 RepID=UPI0016466929|nr:NTP transferase domain-containing protein [Synechococcus sp. PROS-7-1]QNI83935.1 mobA-like NTP transferase domain protein [Synechococcus sp. PROS-7-1]